jgi:hypothetical protein
LRDSPRGLMSESCRRQSARKCEHRPIKRRRTFSMQ